MISVGWQHKDHGKVKHSTLRWFSVKWRDINAGIHYLLETCENEIVLPYSLTCTGDCICEPGSNSPHLRCADTSQNSRTGIGYCTGYGYCPDTRRYVSCTYR